MPAQDSSDVMKLDKQGVIHVLRITIGALISLLSPIGPLSPHW
jgi:hypothetical protein